MAQDTRISVTARNAEANATGALLVGGFLRIYSGPRPAIPDTPPNITNQLLVTFALGNPAFATAVNGTIVSGALAEATVMTSGTAAWFLACTANGVPVFSGSIGVSGADMILPTVALLAAYKIRITSVQYTRPT